MNTALFFITHDGIASSLLHIGESIIGRPMSNLAYHEVAMDSSVLQAMKSIENKLQALDLSDDLIFITDIIGATPSNIAQQLAAKYDAKLISGVNLPMVIRLLNYRDAGIQELVSKAIDGARDSVVLMN
jgi:PTS system ascorbate-specific IIA component